MTVNHTPYISPIPEEEPSYQDRIVLIASLTGLCHINSLVWMEDVLAQENQLQLCTQTTYSTYVRYSTFVQM